MNARRTTGVLRRRCEQEPASKRNPKRCRIAGLLGSAVILLQLAGCTHPFEYVRNGFKVGPNYGTPPAPIAQDWIDAGDKRLHAESDDHAAWWQNFRDPILDNLVEQAYLQNLTLREAGFRILEFRARYNFARGNLFPQTQQFDGANNYNKISQNVANQEFANQDWFGNNEVGFNLAWELDFWGRFRRAVEAADADLDASVEDYDDVLVLLLAEVGRTYVQIRTIAEQLRYTKDNVLLQTENLRIAQARFKGGMSSEVDVDQAAADLAETQALVPELEIQLRVANNALCVLLGRPPTDLADELGAGSIPPAPPEVAVGIPADLIRRRPDVRSAERQAAAQCARIGIAVAELYPHISITGQIGLEAQHFGTQFQGTDSMFGSVGPSFQWNVLNYGRLLNNIRFEDARFQTLLTRYQSVVLSAGAEVENALVAYLRLHEVVLRREQGVAASKKGVELAVINYREGRVPFVAVSLLQTDLVDQQNALAAAQGDLAKAIIDVYEALGGGWQIRLGESTSTSAAPQATEVETPLPPMPDILQPENLPQQGPKIVPPAKPNEDKVPETDSPTANASATTTSTILSVQAASPTDSGDQK